MCGFCGLVGGAEHWGEFAGSALQGEASAPGERQRERLHRAALLDRIARHYGVRVQDWSGSSWLLSHATGETAVIERLADFWPVVERMARRPCDPLSPDLLASLEPGR
jgi:hypothetical protein